MDDRRFDALVRSLASGQNRRSFVKGLLGLGGIAAGIGLSSSETDAARRPLPTSTPSKCPGKQTWNGRKCTCLSGNTDCGAECCPNGQAVCCDNACCHGQCYGEERCCPTGQIVCNDACCAPGEVCFQGVCRRCTICGDDCCSGETSQCCQHDQISTCAPAGITCCAADADCRGLGFCDGLTAHTFTCVDAVCTESTQSCQGADPCYRYTCDQGVCGSTRNPGCCTTSDQCTAVDSCTPASCLGNHTCNAVSACSTGQKCCGGACVASDAHCCTTDDDCSSLDTCDGLLLNAYLCERGLCTLSQSNCGGSDPCTTYGCNASFGGCNVSVDASCCSSSVQCSAVDPCTPARCLEDHTCNALSACGAGETCGQGGTCEPAGCTIDGVLFPPCVEGCNICVAPDGGTLCGCAVSTTQRCRSDDICKELYDNNSICAGPPDSAICVQPSGPLN